MVDHTVSHDNLHVSGTVQYQTELAHHQPYTCKTDAASVSHSIILEMIGMTAGIAYVNILKPLLL